jgi:hypothetical protein
MNVLAKVIGDNKRFSGSGFHEYGLEVDQLWARIDFLELLAGQLDGAFADLGLGGGLSLEFLLNDPVLDDKHLSGGGRVGIESLAGLELGVGLVVANRLLHIEGVDLVRDGHVGRVHVNHASQAQIEVILVLFKGLGGLSARSCVLLGHFDGLLPLESHGGDIVVELCLVLLNDHELVDFLRVVDLDVGVESHGGGVAEPLGDIPALGLGAPLEGGATRGRVCLVLIDEGLRGRKVVWQGSGATSERLLLLDFGALALKLYGDLVEPSEELKVHHEVVEDTEVLGLERNVDGVLCPRQQLAPGWDGMEVSDFREIEVDRQILILILDCEIVVSAFILWAFTERYRLSADLDVRVASTSHHLDLQVIEGFVGAVCTWELDKSH